MQEIVSPKLYVGNLAYEAGESDLFDLFSKVGAVKNVEIAMDRHANRSKGFGFVEMETLETAKDAAEKLNRTDFMGRQIVVSGAKVDKRPINNPHARKRTRRHQSDSRSVTAAIPTQRAPKPSSFVPIKPASPQGAARFCCAMILSVLEDQPGKSICPRFSLYAKRPKANAENKRANPRSFIRTKIR